MDFRRLPAVELTLDGTVHTPREAADSIGAIRTNWLRSNTRLFSKGSKAQLLPYQRHLRANKGRVVVSIQNLADESRWSARAPRSRTGALEDGLC